VSQDPRFQAAIDRITGVRTYSLLCVPLSLPDRIVGAIAATNKLDKYAVNGRGHFSEKDEQLLQGAAAFVAMAVENARLHAAAQEAAAIETLQDTVVTLSHYVNNPLQSLMGAADLLRKDLVGICKEDRRIEESVAYIARLIEKKAREISVVISVLRDVAVPASTTYLDSMQMLDIEKELTARLASPKDWAPEET
jgi:K+-sensing histidine kinase KdpD